MRSVGRVASVGATHLGPTVLVVVLDRPTPVLNRGLLVPRLRVGVGCRLAPVLWCLRRRRRLRGRLRPLRGRLRGLLLLLDGLGVGVRGRLPLRRPLRAGPLLPLRLTLVPLLLVGGRRRVGGVLPAGPEAEARAGERVGAGRRLGRGKDGRDRRARRRPTEPG